MNEIPMKLSKNFSLNEFTRSQTATRRGFNNEPDEGAIYNLGQLCDFVLQPLRDAMGHAIHISSGYRGLSLNTAIHGSKTSQHVFGKAADIDSANKNKIYFDYIRKNLPFDQLIWEFGDSKSPDWVHVSYSTNNRKQILTAYRDEYGTQYKPFKG